MQLLVNLSLTSAIGRFVQKKLKNYCGIMVPQETVLTAPPVRTCRLNCSLAKLFSFTVQSIRTTGSLPENPSPSVRSAKKRQYGTPARTSALSPQDGTRLRGIDTSIFSSFAVKTKSTPASFCSIFSMRQDEDRDAVLAISKTFCTGRSTA